MGMIQAIGVGVLVMASGWLAQPAAAEEYLGAAIARAYGFEHWDQIETLEFTFNVKLPDREVQRTWRWEVSEQRVTRTIDNEQSRISLTEPGLSGREDGVHGQFINDTYWLLFPFQLEWSNPDLTDHGQADLPLGEGQTARKVTCQWPEVGGYTPGDAYDLYLGEDGLVQQWVFRRGGQDGGYAHTWEDHQRLGPIIVSLDHYGPEGSGFRLWFTDVQATLTDGMVVTAQPTAEP